MSQLTIRTANARAKSVGPKGAPSSPSGSVESRLVPATIPVAAAILAEAYHYAQSLNRDVWEFALELPNLSVAGVSINDLRWLACNGYVNHSKEIEPNSEGQRVFRTYTGLGFTQGSCFVLTPLGVQFAQRVVQPNGSTSSTPTNHCEANRLRMGGRSTVCEEDCLPHWDHNRRELVHLGTVVKQFRKPSPNQVTVLQAFEEEGWPTRVDDPLPPVSELDPKRRLHDTIKSLNRHQRAETIRFLGDGQGEGIIWESR